MASTPNRLLQQLDESTFDLSLTLLIDATAISTVRATVPAKCHR